MREGILVPSSPAPETLEFMKTRPLHYVALCGNIQCLEDLIRSDHTSVYNNYENKTPLEYAVKNDNKESIKLILHGKFPGAVNETRGPTSLHWAVFHGHKDPKG